MLARVVRTVAATCRRVPERIISRFSCAQPRSFGANTREWEKEDFLLSTLVLRKRETDGQKRVGLFSSYFFRRGISRERAKRFLVEKSSKHNNTSVDDLRDELFQAICCSSARAHFYGVYRLFSKTRLPCRILLLAKASITVYTSPAICIIQSLHICCPSILWNEWNGQAKYITDRVPRQIMSDQSSMQLRSNNFSLRRKQLIVKYIRNIHVFI